MRKRNSRSLPGARPEADPQAQLGLERLVFLNDAVFALAITLLALEVRLPAGPEITSDGELLARLLRM